MFQLDLPDHLGDEIDDLRKLRVMTSESNASVPVIINILSLYRSELLQGTSLLDE